MDKKGAAPVAIIVLLVLGFFWAYNTGNLNFETPGGDCPQINVSMADHHIFGKLIYSMTYEGWKVRGDSYSFLQCLKGNEEGENPNYWYCGDPHVHGWENADYGLIQKTEIQEDGTYGKTIRKSFYSVYDENGLFIKTVCGEDPNAIREEQFKNEMREVANFFSLD